MLADAGGSAFGGDTDSPCAAPGVPEDVVGAGGDGTDGVAADWVRTRGFASSNISMPAMVAAASTPTTATSGQTGRERGAASVIDVGAVTGTGDSVRGRTTVASLLVIAGPM